MSGWLGFLFKPSNFFLIGGVALTVIGTFFYASNLKFTVEQLKDEKQMLVEINTNQTQKIEELVAAQTASNKRITSLLKDVEGLRKESQDLRDKLIEHDLKELAIRKPGLIERRINDGTQEVFDELNEITTP